MASSFPVNDPLPFLQELGEHVNLLTIIIGSFNGALISQKVSVAHIRDIIGQSRYMQFVLENDSTSQRRLAGNPGIIKAPFKPSGMYGLFDAMHTPLVEAGRKLMEDLSKRGGYTLLIDNAHRIPLHALKVEMDEAGSIKLAADIESAGSIVIPRDTLIMGPDSTHDVRLMDGEQPPQEVENRLFRKILAINLFSKGYGTRNEAQRTTLAQEGLGLGKKAGFAVGAAIVELQHKHHYDCRLFVQHLVDNARDDMQKFIPEINASLKRLEDERPDLGRHISQQRTLMNGYLKTIGISLDSTRAASLS